MRSKVEPPADPRELLQSAGLNITNARLAIIKELEGDLTHPTADELYDRLQKKHSTAKTNKKSTKTAPPAVSRATVYNCLEALVKIGYLNRVDGGAARRFDPNRERHFHAVCDRCGAILDVDPQSLQQMNNWKPPSELPGGFKVSSLDAWVRGECGECANAV